jgi:hypothetical protein
MNILIVYIFIIIGLLYLFKTKERFGWSCYYTPQKNYYKQTWLLGGNQAAESLARDSIKPIINT